MMEPQTKLTGAELKAKVDELIKAGEGFSACCRATGYVNKGPNDTKIPAASGFSRALLDALGYAFPTGSGTGAGGRARDGKIRVLGAGNAIISKGYAKEAGISPGDELAIKIHDNGTITLTKDNKKPVLETIREVAKDDWSPDFADT